MIRQGCEQILENFDKSVLELYEHSDKEHTIVDDSRVQEMRRICIELLGSRNLQAGNRDLVETDQG
jgi:hypothetical protein